MSRSKPAAGSLEAVQATPEGLERYRAAVEYVERAESASEAGRGVRDVELRRLCREHGPTKVAKMTGASLGTVKAANKPSNDR